jgi:hypothetical protein
MRSFTSCVDGGKLGRGRGGFRRGLWAVGLLGMAGVAAAAPVTVTVSMENRAPTKGFFLTPLWVAFHDGTFTTYAQGTSLGAGNPFERLVEDGVTGPISQAFVASPAGAAGGGVDRTIGGTGGAVTTPAVYDPGEKQSASFTVDSAMGRYFTFASMVIPSNDAFIGNATPIEIFDAAGNFKGPITLIVRGTDVHDAGTELNNEVNAAFFNQATNGLGDPTDDAVSAHPGLLGSVGRPGTSPIILGGTSTAPVPGIMFDRTAADFTVAGAEVARITIVPEPSVVGVGVLAVTCSGLWRGRNRFHVSTV